MKLISYSSITGGGMAGGHSSTFITYTEDGRSKVETSDKPYHSSSTTHVIYYAEGLLEKLSDVCERYNVITWTYLPDNDILVYDEASSTDHFIFEDGTDIVLGNRTKSPTEAREMYHEFVALIKDSINYATELKEEHIKEQPFLMMGMMGQMPSMADVRFDVPKTDTPKEDASTWAKFCKECGAEFKGSQKFCPECGALRPKQ